MYWRVHNIVIQAMLTVTGACQDTGRENENSMCFLKFSPGGQVGQCQKVEHVYRQVTKTLVRIND